MVFLAKKNKKDTPVYFAKKISELKNLGRLAAGSAAVGG